MPALNKTQSSGQSASLLKRGEEIKTRTKNHVKLVEERPKELKTGIAAKKKMGPALDLEVSWNRIHAMGNQADAPGPQEEEEDLPALPDSEEEEEQEGGQGLEAQEYGEEQGQEDEEQEGDEQEEEEVQGGGRGRVAEQEGARLLDTLHLGRCWLVEE